MRKLAIALAVGCAAAFQAAPLGAHRATTCLLADAVEYDAGVSDVEAHSEEAALEPIDVDEGVSDIEVTYSDPANAVGGGGAGAAGPEASRLKVELLQLAARTSRGETATMTEKDAARTLASALEACNPTADSAGAASNGVWELVFSDTELFRSSPFFMAGRAVCEDGTQARQYDWFCEMHRKALAISTIGKVRQIKTDGLLVSEFETTAGAVPFLSSLPLPAPLGGYGGGLPLGISGSIVSTATIEATSPSTLTLLMDTVEIKGSNLPGVRQLLDSGLALRSRALGSALEAGLPGYENPRPMLEITYVDEDTRISRDQDGKLLVYSRIGGVATPTDYSDRPADLGVGKLLDGMQRAFL